MSLSQPLAWSPITPPTLVDGQGQFHLGRYRQAFVDANFHPAVIPSWTGPRRGPATNRLQRGLRRLFTKEWHYLSISSPEVFLALCPVQLGYVSNLFVYVVDPVSGQFQEVGDRVPLGRGFSLAPSSLVGSSRWQHGQTSIEIAATPPGWEVHLDIQGKEMKLAGDIQITRGEALALVYPLDGGRAAYTHKEAGLITSGTLRWNSREFTLDKALATSDWTRSFANRRTEWQWASLAANVDGRRVGLNLSARVYDADGAGSQENALWVDGRMIPLGGVKFGLPDQPDGNWTLQGGEGSNPWLSLEFVPRGTRREDANYGIVESRFIQPYGQFRGFVAPPGEARLELDGVFGVVEDHHSLW